jgi:hypothetical protein
MQAAAAAANGAGDVQKPQQQPLVAGAPPPPPPAAVVPPHWVAMPFAPPPGAAAMVMQPHHMAPPPPQFAPTHFVPFHAVAPPRAAAVALGSPAPHQPGQEENKSVWVGDLHYWMDENYLHSCFGYTGEVSTDARPTSSLTSPDLGHGTTQLHETKKIINLSTKKGKEDVSFALAHESFFFDVTSPCCFLPQPAD